MASVSGFEDLQIWQLARKQANELFQLYTCGPFATDYSLRNQINAASGSVMDNIAEGFERSGNKEFLNFLVIAKGSNGEVRSQLLRALDRKYISTDIFQKLLSQNIALSSKIANFMKYLKSSVRKGFRYE
ncbi:MAG: four helix bundle protein [Chitinophagaceae bacterium]